MSVKVSTGLKDAWGQEIFLGDLVVDIVSGAYYANNTPSVVTRVGSANNFQKNGSSYSKPENHVVVTTQYVSFKGQAAHEELLDKYPIEFEAVRKKNSPVLCGVATQAYLMTGESRKFYVFRWEDSERGRKEITAIRTHLGCSTYLYFLSPASSYRSTVISRSHEFSSNTKCMSTKKLLELEKELGVDFTLWYNMEITDPQITSILQKFV